MDVIVSCFNCKWDLPQSMNIRFDHRYFYLKLHKFYQIMKLFSPPLSLNQREYKEISYKIRPLNDQACRWAFIHDIRLSELWIFWRFSCGSTEGISFIEYLFLVGGMERIRCQSNSKRTRKRVEECGQWFWLSPHKQDAAFRPSQWF